MQDPAVKQQFLRNAEHSVARGTFGSPTFFVGEEIWFGRDRPRDVEDYLSRESGRGQDA
jgi:2-hydroxychromene-2-carboxylate isomerase